MHWHLLLLVPMHILLPQGAAIMPLLSPFMKYVPSTYKSVAKLNSLFPFYKAHNVSLSFFHYPLLYITITHPFNIIPFCLYDVRLQLYIMETFFSLYFLEHYLSS